MQDAFHYAKYSEILCFDFGNFGFFKPECSGSPLEVVHLFRSKYSDQNSPFHFRQTGSLPYFSTIPLGWPGLIGKCRSLFREHWWSLTGRFGIMERTPSLVSEQEFGSFNHHQHLTIVCSSFGRLGKKERAGSAISPKTATKATLSLNQRKGRQSCGTIIFWTKTQVHKCVRLFHLLMYCFIKSKRYIKSSLKFKMCSFYCKRLSKTMCKIIS